MRQPALRAVEVKAEAPRPRGASNASSLDVDEHRARMGGPVAEGRCPGGCAGTAGGTAGLGDPAISKNQA
jgi:hypothetical protein